MSTLLYPFAALAKILLIQISNEKEERKAPIPFFRLRAVPSFLSDHLTFSVGTRSLHLFISLVPKTLLIKIHLSPSLLLSFILRRCLLADIITAMNYN
jgi:hypothetical protein